MTKYTVLDDRLHAYMLAHQPTEHDQLRALRARTSVLPDARWQITPEQGHLLDLLVRVTGARKVLEIGTFTGYSALAMALALPPGGQLVACDRSAEWTSISRAYWKQAGVADRIDLRIAPAIDTLRCLQEAGRGHAFDMAFIDADKIGYDAYYEATLRLIRSGGLIVLDNTLRRGRVADPDEKDEDTLALRAINAKIARDERVHSVLLPVASGMTLARVR